MHSLAEAKPVHAKWSEANREFLEFVERNPSYLERASFAALENDPQLYKFVYNPWPLFAGPEQIRGLAEVALGVNRLVKGSIERFLRGDVERIMEFFRSEHLEDTAEREVIVLQMSEEVIELLRMEPTGVQGAPSRGDYIETAEGLKCVEFNAGGFLGGLQTQSIGELYLRAPTTQRFLRERGIRARAPQTLAALFRHALDDTARLGAWKGGEFNLAMLAYPHVEREIALHDVEIYERELGRVLRERGIDAGGRVFVCGSDDFVPEGEGKGLAVQGRTVHAVIEQHNGGADLRALLWYFKHRRINLYSGPIAAILCDKRNLALISENAGSDDFTAAERDLIERHVPWTRRVVPARTDFRGRTIRLPDDLPELRERMVLKKATSLGGYQVHIGRYLTDGQWREIVARAVREVDWVAQEFLETVPYWFQSGPAGASRHDVVWGLLAFGEEFGGAFLRMHAAGDYGGVVNAHRGAEVTVLLELEE